MERSENGNGVLIGVLIVLGCLLTAPVLLLGGTFLLMVVGRTLFPTQVPEGEPLVMRQEQIAGTWRDDSGGSLVLRRDGTFASDGVCGDFRADALWGAEAPDPGSGGWGHLESEDTETDEPMSAVRLTFAPGGVWTQYEARGTAERAVLWTYVGDPDGGEPCVLERVAE